MDPWNRERLTGTSSGFEFGCATRACFYRYHVTMWKDAADAEDITTYSNEEDDGTRFERETLCRGLLQQLFEATDDASEPLKYAYNGRHSLYVPGNPLPASMLREVVLNRATTTSATASGFEAIAVVVRIRPRHKGTPVMVARALQECRAGRANRKTRRELAEFFDCISDAWAIQSATYEPCDGGKLYEVCERDFREQLAVRGGVSKKIGLPSPANGLNAPVYFADVRNQAFYRSERLVTLFRLYRRDREDTNDGCLEAFLQLYRGVRCRLIYAPTATVTIQDYGLRTKDVKINRMDNDEAMYLVDYLRDKKQVRIVDDTLPTIRTNESGVVFPMEVLEVLPNQRVALQNMSIDLQKALLEANILRPSEREAALKKHLDVIFCAESRSLMRSFGATIGCPGGSLQTSQTVFSELPSTSSPYFT